MVKKLSNRLYFMSPDPVPHCFMFPLNNNWKFLCEIKLRFSHPLRNTKSGKEKKPPFSPPVSFLRCLLQPHDQICFSEVPGDASTSKLTDAPLHPA